MINESFWGMSLLSPTGAMFHDDHDPPPSLHREMWRRKTQQGASESLRLIWVWIKHDDD